MESHSRPSKSHSALHKKQKHKSREVGEDAEKKARLEKLRKERLEREESEKVKSEALLKQHYGLVQDSGPRNDTEPSRPRK